MDKDGFYLGSDRVIDLLLYCLSQAQHNGRSNSGILRVPGRRSSSSDLLDPFHRLKAC